MREFRIRVTRVYNIAEQQDDVVYASTPEAALEIAKQREIDGEYDFIETVGGADPSSYEWDVVEDGKTVLTGTGTNDYEEA